MSEHESTDASEERPDEDAREWHRQRTDVDHTKILKVAAGVLLAFTALGWGSIPLYRLVCKSLDPGGSAASAGSAANYEDVQVDESRTIDVRFTANVQGDLDWEFRPLDSSVEVNPGEKKLVKFVAKNNHDRPVTGKAIYDINPPESGPSFKKIECFCFVKQTLEPGERMVMPLYFWLEPDLPESVNHVTLGYTFFNAEDAPESRRGKRVSASSK